MPTPSTRDVPLHRSHRLRRGRLGALLSVLAAGCGLPERDGGGVEQVVLTIGVVPADVACVRITATGAARTVLREIDVAAGTAVSESFSGLPLGPVAFKAEAFPGACEDVTRSTIPTWASESVSASIAVGRLSTVALVLYRNGRAKVGVDFIDEQADGGAAPDAGATAD